MNKKNLNFSSIFFAILIFIFVRNIINQTAGNKQISYDDFFQKLKTKQISEVFISTDSLKGINADSTDKTKTFTTNQVEPFLAKDLDQFGVKYSQVSSNTFLTDLASWIFPPLIFVLIWFFFMKKMAGKMGGGSLMSIGKSKVKVYIEKDTGITFNDVAGVDEAKEELQEIVNFLKDGTRYGKLGGRMPKGALLVGPPGTGKTLLAKAVAGEAGVPFFSISGSEFVEMFVGVGAARVRDLFEQARKSSPCIIFIDELDALGKARASVGMSGGNDEKEQTLNQLLTEMDGFDSKEGIIILAATNRPEVLDPALLRAGRFDRQILVDRPDKQGRLQILKVHAKKIILAPEVELEQVAALTTGFTGADLANLVNEAALVATRKNKINVSVDDFTLAIERIVAGLEKKNRILNPFEREVTAHHEMGHALTSILLHQTEVIHKVSIIPRGIGALGYTIQRPTEERFLMKREELENKICVLLGGRVAEGLVFRHLSTGASDDLTRATDIAASMATQYGMCEELGHVVYHKEVSSYLSPTSQRTFEYSNETAREIDLSIKTIIENCYSKTSQLLNQNLDVLKSSAKLLLEKETLDADQLNKIAKDLV